MTLLPQIQQEFVFRFTDSMEPARLQLAVNAEKLEKDHIEREEQEMREVLELMFEIKIKKLGFPDPWAKAA